MKKLITKIIIMIMLLSIGYYLGRMFTGTNEIKEAIAIHGSNDNWEINDFKVIIYEQKVQWGGGKVKYLGDPIDLDNLKSFKFEIIKEPIGEKDRVELLYLKSISSNHGFSIGTEIAAVTFGGADRDKNRYIVIENYESNISGKENYNFDENHIIRVKVYLEYIDGEKIEDEFHLETIIMNKETFDKIHVQSETK